MSERPTPETDEVRRANDCNAAGFFLMASHAKKLERERDEALEALEFRRELFKVQEAQLNENRERCNELQNELAALKRTAHWLFSRLSIYLDGEQFIGTAQRLERIGEENPWLKESYIP